MFSPPTAFTVDSPEDDSGAGRFKKVIIAWEKLRIVFNLVILTVGLATSWTLHAGFGGWMPYVFWAVVYGITVNAFYSLGPLLEIYAVCFSPRENEIIGFGSRIPLFVFGLIVSILVTGWLAFSVHVSFAAEGIRQFIIEN